MPKSKFPSERQIVAELKKLFGPKREGLKERVREFWENAAFYDDLGRELRRSTGQAVNWNHGLDESSIKSAEEDCDLSDSIGDISYLYGVALNKGIKRTQDFGERLSIRCGGTAHICELQISGLYPYYFMDLYSQTYDKKTDIWEFCPFRPKAVREKRTADTIRRILREAGLKRVSKEFALTNVRGAATDCERDNPTVYDCLFSDIWGFHETKVRYNGRPLDDISPGSHVSWRETYDRKGKVTQTKVTRCYSSFTVETTILNSQMEIEEITIKDRDWNEVTFNVKEKLKAARRKNKRSNR